MFEYGPGFSPFAGVVMDSKENLYGTTALGGSGHGICIENGCGTVFRLGQDGSFKALYLFNDETDGAYPLASVILDNEGNVYGTAWEGGDISCNSDVGCGTVFKVTPNGKETTLYAFKTFDLGFPESPLVRDAAGNLYGTTYGPNGGCCGVVFKIDSQGKETILHRFTGGDDGASPVGGVVFDENGNLYGTASSGGKYARGTIYKITP